MPIRTATVRAADIPSSQTDFPFYVDLGRVGATALTLAEAQSSRWYTDTDLVTQMAREIVSLTEGHGKYASLTSTSKVAIDYDGIRADLAVGDTFGRNNVWSDYIAVFHMVDANSSTGSNNASNTGVTFSTSNGKIREGANFNNSSDVLSVTDAASIKPVNITVSSWVYPTSLAGFPIFIDRFNANTADGYRMYFGSSRLNFEIMRGSSVNVAGATTVSINNWYYVVGTYNGTNVIAYLNGVSDATASTSGNIAYSTSTDLGIGKRTTGSASNLTGDIDEMRLKNSASSANWITTEYNNQNDEATFWGTWTTFGGGGFTPTPLMHMRMMAGGGV